VGVGNLCHQAIFVDDATRAVMPPDPEMIQVGDCGCRKLMSRSLTYDVRPRLTPADCADDGNGLSPVPKRADAFGYAGASAVHRRCGSHGDAAASALPCPRRRDGGSHGPYPPLKRLPRGDPAQPLDHLPGHGDDLSVVV
jgi:hypothetical protein